MIALFQHHGNHARKASAHQQVLVDKHVAADKAEARRDLAAVRHPHFQHVEHRARVVEHGGAHDGGARAGTGDHAAIAVHRPDGLQCRRAAAVRAQQRLRDAALVAAGKIDAAGRLDLGDDGRIFGRLAVVAVGQLHAQRHKEGIGAILIELGHDAGARFFGIDRSGRHHGDARALAAGQIDDALPHFRIVGAQAAADDHQRALRCIGGDGWRGGGQHGLHAGDGQRHRQHKGGAHFLKRDCDGFHDAFQMPGKRRAQHARRKLQLPCYLKL